MRTWDTAAYFEGAFGYTKNNLSVNRKVKKIVKNLQDYQILSKIVWLTVVGAIRHHHGRLEVLETDGTSQQSVQILKLKHVGGDVH